MTVPAILVTMGTAVMASIVMTASANLASQVMVGRQVMFVWGTGARKERRRWL